MSKREFSTPMMQQYMQIKTEYADCLLLFRLGDFYELFLDDAEVGAKVLGITLTARPRGKDGDIPMAGVPFHSATSYISKLVKAGYKVAICEQTSEPDGKGIVEREVVRIITPGTVTDEASLNHRQHNYLMSLSADESRVGLVFAELTTGEIFLTEFETTADIDRLANEIARFSPAEVIHSPTLPTSLDHVIKPLKEKSQPLEKWTEYSKKALKTIRQQFSSQEVKRLKLTGSQPVTQALAVCLKYLNHTQKQLVTHLKTVEWFSGKDSLLMDASTIENLEIFETLRGHQTEGSLLGVLDKTQTAMGSRLLRYWLQHPLTSHKQIESRHNSLSYLLDHPEFVENVLATLHPISDLERLLSRINLNQTNPKDLQRLQRSLKQVVNLKKQLNDVIDPLLQKQSLQIDPRLIKITSAIQNNLQDDVPVDPKKGNFIKPGVSQELDKLRKVISESKKWIAKSQETERQRTGISSLKIKFNKVFGYYIEISKANLDQIPDDYERKQTLVNSERFITPELKKHEQIVLTNQTKAEELELELFNTLNQKIVTSTVQLQQAAKAVAVVDCLLSLAQVARQYDYIRPTIKKHGVLKIKDGRHPVVEQLLDDKQFVPNDTTLGKDHQLIVITGPNMAGKSVYMRQVALIALMAHIGSFVPATQATVPIIDRIFVRSGAGDAITQGLSTFMVEMVETAQILNRATPHSLVIMDEIGRGTTTFDGISIAWAVAEYLVTHIKVKTLFATHYHELQNLEDEYPGQIKNFYAAVEQHQGEPVFIHRILQGKAAASYGIGVAKLAGVPEMVTTQAQHVLRTLESNENIVQPDSSITLQTSLFSDTEVDDNIRDQIRQVDIAQTTPLEALTLIAKLQKQLTKE